MINPRRLPPLKYRGAVNKVVAVLIAVVVVGCTMAFRMWRGGETSVSFMFYMSLAGVIALAFVAPRIFTEGKDRPPWERKEQPKRESSNEPKP